MSDNELDNLFKEAADGFKAPMDSSAWKDMSKKLDQAGVGTSVFWNWKTISVVTAVGVLSGAFIWYASQGDVDQRIADKNSIDAKIKNEALIPSQEKEIEISGVEKKQEPESLKTRENQKTVSSNTNSEDSKPGAQKVRATTRAVNEPENKKSEFENTKSLDGNNQSKVTERTEIKTSSSTPSSGAVNKSEANRQDLGKNETQNAKTIIIPSSAAAINASTASEGKVTTSNSSTTSGVTNTTKIGEQKVTVSENSSKERKSNVPDDNSLPVNEGEAKKSIAGEKSPSEGKIIPAGVIVSSEENGTKTEKQNSNISENRTLSSKSNSTTESNQEAAPVTTDSVVKPVHDLPLVGERADSTSRKKEPNEEKTKAASALSFKVAVAPDFSSINYFTPDGSGFNFGALVGYSFNNRWSVYTGAILSRKIYSSTEIDEAYTTSSGYPYDINELTGDCRVLDIPINVYYSFFPEKSFSIKAGLGFTSYLMLSEEYTYYIDNPYGSDVYHQKIENENNEWFKMMNISMIVQKKLSNQFSLELEPFLKAPLAGVGEGEVSLVSIGAFLNLRFDIPLKNKKE